MTMDGTEVVEFYCFAVKDEFSHYAIRFGSTSNSTSARVSFGKLSFLDEYGIIYNDNIMLGGCLYAMCGFCAAGSYVDVWD